MDAHHGNRERDERTEQLRAEIDRLVADATDESRSQTYRDWCARRIPHTQALLFARLDRAAGHREDPWTRNCRGRMRPWNPPRPRPPMGTWAVAMSARVPADTMEVEQR